MGSAGQEFIGSQLNEGQDIEAAVRTIQERGSLPDRRVKPLLQFLDQLNLTRCGVPARGYHHGQNRKATRGLGNRAGSSATYMLPQCLSTCFGPAICLPAKL